MTADKRTSIAMPLTSWRPSWPAWHFTSPIEVNGANYRVERPEDVDRIVTDIGGDDGVGLAANSRGHDTAVVGVGECHRVLQSAHPSARASSKVSSMSANGAGPVRVGSYRQGSHLHLPRGLRRCGGSLQGTGPHSYSEGNATSGSEEAARFLSLAQTTRVRRRHRYAEGTRRLLSPIGKWAYTYWPRHLSISTGRLVGRAMENAPLTALVVQDYLGGKLRATVEDART